MTKNSCKHSRDIRLVLFVKIYSIYNTLYDVSCSHILDAFKYYESLYPTICEDITLEAEIMRKFII